MLYNIGGLEIIKKDDLGNYLGVKTEEGKRYPIYAEYKIDRINIMVNSGEIRIEAKGRSYKIYPEEGRRT